MKYFSEKLNKVFDAEEELHKAESAFDKEEKQKKKAQRDLQTQREELDKKIGETLDAIQTVKNEYQEMHRNLFESYSERSNKLYRELRELREDRRKLSEKAGSAYFTVDDFWRILGF